MRRTATAWLFVLASAVGSLAGQLQIRPAADVPDLPQATAPTGEANPIAAPVPVAAPEPIADETPLSSPSADEPDVELMPEQAIPTEEYIEPLEESESEATDSWPTCMIDDFTFDFPKWYLRSDALWYERTTQGELITATTRDDNGNLGNYRVGSNDFDLVPGMRVHVGRNFNDGMTYFEVGYTGPFQWKSDRFLGLDTDLFIISSNLDLGLIELDANDNRRPFNQFVAYRSNLNQGEINVRNYLSPCFAIAGGFRYMGLTEELIVAENGFTTTGNGVFPALYNAKLDTAVENSILALQLGTDMYWEMTDDIRWNLVAMIGAAGNFTQATIRQTVDLESLVVSDLDGFARLQHDEEWALTGFVEFNVGLDIQLTRNIVVFGGYNFMWLANVAMATEQVPNAINDPNGVQRQIENGADLILFGPSVGFQISWGGVD